MREHWVNFESWCGANPSSHFIVELSKKNHNFSYFIEFVLHNIYIWIQLYILIYSYSQALSPSSFERYSSPDSSSSSWESSVNSEPFNCHSPELNKSMVSQSTDLSSGTFDLELIPSRFGAPAILKAATKSLSSAPFVFLIFSLSNSSFVWEMQAAFLIAFSARFSLAAFF